MIIHLIVEFTKKTLLDTMSCFPPFGHSKSKIDVELTLSNFATTFDLKNALKIRG